MELDPTGKERLDRINRLVFDRTNLKKLRDAICNLFDIFHEILEKDFEYGCYFVCDDIISRLHEVNQHRWDEIREHFIEDSYHSYDTGNFMGDEMRDPGKLILDLIQQIVKCKEGLFQKLEQKHEEVVEAEKKAESYRVKSMEAYEKLMAERQEIQDKLLEAARTKTKSLVLEKLCDEKTEKLQELQRVRTVSMWEKEREKVVKDYQQKIDDLEDELAFLKHNTKAITRRMSNIDDQNKMFKLKQERSKSFQAESTPDLESLKRDIYVRDRDISHLEGELYEQQKLFMGVIAGLRTDISKLSQRFYDAETSERDPEFVKLLNHSNKIYTALSEGTLQQTKQLMPPHYTFHDKDVKIKRIRRLSKANTLPKLSLSGLPSDPLPNISNNGNSPATEQKPLSTLVENPIIVDPKTNKMNGIVYLRHFAHMSQKFILDHWEKFKQFDCNGDQMLDVEETSSLLQGLGLQFSIHQIEVVGWLNSLYWSRVCLSIGKYSRPVAPGPDRPSEFFRPGATDLQLCSDEAMDEVDIDKSHTLDFYEYLLVVDKITKKSGKAALFKQGISKSLEGTKVCVIQ